MQHTHLSPAPPSPRPFFTAHKLEFYQFIVHSTPSRCFIEIYYGLGLFQASSKLSKILALYEVVEGLQRYFSEIA
jgi:hypothetical protein